MGRVMTDRLDDPRYSVTALEFHLAQNLPVAVHGRQLSEIRAEVDETLADLVALPDEVAFGDLCFITTTLLGVKQFLDQLQQGFDAAGTSKREGAS
jgi:hypothetical protein